MESVEIFFIESAVSKIPLSLPSQKEVYHADHRLKRLRKHRQGAEKYKKKFEKSKTLIQLRERQSFTKPSVKRRGEVLKAVYKQQIASGKIEVK